MPGVERFPTFLALVLGIVAHRRVAKVDCFDIPLGCLDKDCLLLGRRGYPFDFAGLVERHLLPLPGMCGHKVN